MQNENNSYRIRTEIGVDSPNVINVKLDQTFEFLNILSLKIGQKNFYKMPVAPYGVIAGRVLLGGKSFGIENAKVSVFIPKDNTVFEVKDNVLYSYSSVNSTNYDGVRYNLLPSYVDETCHQNVGTMFEKEYVLDNNDVIRIFDKYYTYTTRTNNAGDYFIYGVPVGQQTLHVDVDLSDIGALSVRPHDMIGQGYDIGQFESPNKFKAGKNLNILPQIKSHDRAIYVYPFWGDTTEDENNALITRADIEIDYKFEPSAVFIGSIISDKGSNSISHKCVPDDKNGLMSDMITGEGKIEMIRKTFDGRVEQFSVKGNRLIDGDGVWCYQVPMNLDYVVMDEFGNLVPTDNPEKGIPTRARVRFRISMDESPMDDTARKRARFLVPNNPRLTDDYPDFQKTHEADYEFGTFTKEESYRDMFWNNVYTVKSYIPRLQKRVTARTKKFTGVKMVNHSGDNNPMPYNNLSIKMGFVYRFLCTMLTMFLWSISFINTSVLIPISLALFGLALPFRNLANVFYGIDVIKVAEKIGNFFNDIACFFEKAAVNMIIKIPPGMCEDDSPDKTYILGEKNVIKNWTTIAKDRCKKCGLDSSVTGNEVTSDMDSLLNCAQNALAQDQEVTSFNFQNDWVNGVLYAPLWYRKIKPKRRILFGLITTTGHDNWCDGGNSEATKGKIWGLKLYQTCSTNSADSKTLRKIKKDNKYTESGCYGYQCHNRALSVLKVEKGLIVRKETKTGEYVYYYKSVEYGNDNTKILFATDLVLLGSLNDCDKNGIPQFFKHLEETTYNMPPDLVSLTWNSKEKPKSDKPDKEDNDTESAEVIEEEIDDSSVHTEYTGADYGNAGWDQWYDPDYVESKYVKNGNNDYDNGGLFYNLNCNFSYVKPKCCINLSRVCELGVALDQSIDLPIEARRGVTMVMPPDGFISYDELYNMDARAMFATMNGNRLRVKQDMRTGFPVYDFNYLYPENFDGVLEDLMKGVPLTNDRGERVLYRENYKLERSSSAYLRFRYGLEKDWEKFRIHTYNSVISTIGDFIRTENSFYFYFGLKSGKTAIEKFRNNFYAECTNDEPSTSVIVMDHQPNSWCNDMDEEEMDGYVSFDLSRLELPCSITFDNRNYSEYDAEYRNLKDYKIYIGNHNQGLEDQGYVQLKIGNDFNQDPNGVAPTLKNGYYIVTIVDGNGEVYRINLSYEAEMLSFESAARSFTLTNEELMRRFSGRTYDDIAGDTTRSGNDPARLIGGYIELSSLMDGKDALNNNFKITIEGVDIEDANDPMGTYSGSEYKKVNGIVTTTGVPCISANNGVYIFGVPKGDKTYRITVTKICVLNGEQIETNDRREIELIVSQAQPLKMFINGIDYDLLSDGNKFKTGYQYIHGIATEPDSGYTPSTGVTSSMVGGWLDFRLGQLAVLPTDPHENGFPSSYNAIREVVECLESDEWDVPNSAYNHPYKFTDEYIFHEDDIDKPLDEYTEVPDPNDPNNTPGYIWPQYIKVADVNDPFQYWVYELNYNTRQYNIKTDTNNQRCAELTLQEYFDMNNEAKIEVVEALNIVIEKRLELVDEMIRAFWMYDTEEENKLVTITYQTNETPVKTLVYYIPDQTDNVIQQGSTRYEVLDMNKEENTITSNSNPTITAYKGKPVFFDYKDYDGSTHKYKCPPHCAIQNSMYMTTPMAMYQQQPDPFTPPQGVNGVMEDMFGFHIIDKRPFTEINIWIPLNNYPIYWPDITIGSIQPPEGIEVGGYVTVNGCVSGYFFNGFSTSKDCVAQFESQTIGDNICMYTTTVDSNGYPDENHVPTKRLIYKDQTAISVTPSYNDYIKTSNPSQGFDDETNQIPSPPNTDYRYISYMPSVYYMIVKDRMTTFKEPLYGSSKFGLPENSIIPELSEYTTGISNLYDLNVYNSRFPKPSFSTMNENIYFQGYWSGKSLGSPSVAFSNPIYQRVYDNSSVLPDGTNSLLNMVYKSSLTAPKATESGLVDNPHNQSVSKVFFIGMTKDGKVRGVSPTYEISAVKGNHQSAPNLSDTYVLLDFNNENNNRNRYENGYYIAHYPFQIVLRDLANTTLATSDFITYDTAVWGANNKMIITFEGVWNSIIDRVYVKDVTGIMRQVITPAS